MGKHEYEDVGMRHDGLYAWAGNLVCKHCDHVSGLDDWQLKNMPIEMARCPKSPTRIGFWERLRNSINCSV